MALLKKDTSAAPTATAALNTKPAVKPTAPIKRPALETAPEDDDEAEEQQATQDHAIAEVPAPARNAVAIPVTGGLLASTRMVPVLESLKNALRVNFDTLPHLQINQGNLLVKEGKVMLGDEALLELLSYQDNFVISPGEDGEEALSALRYSDDGITCSTGEDVQDYLRALQEADYPKAQLKARCVLVVNLLHAGKGAKVAEHYDNLYQIDLAPSSKSKFDAYRAQVSFKCSRGKMDPQDSPYMKLSVNVVERGSNSWSVGSFDTATAADRAVAS